MPEPHDVDDHGNCSRCGGVHYGTGPVCAYAQESNEEKKLQERLEVLENTDLKHPEPRSLEEHVHDLLVWLNLSDEIHDLSLEQVEAKVAERFCAYAEQETTSQKLQIAVLIRLLERVRDAEDPEEYLDDVAAVDESTLAEEGRVFLRERDALLAVAQAATLYLRCFLGIDDHYSSSGPGKSLEDALAHPDVQRLLKKSTRL